SWRRPFVRFEAAGFGLAVLRRFEGHDSPDRALLVPLPAAARLNVRIVDAHGTPGKDVMLTLRAQGYDLTIVDPSWAGTMVEVPAESWVAMTGEDGRCAIEGICPEIGLEVELRDKDGLLRRETDRL